MLPRPGSESISRPSQHTPSVGLRDFFVSATGLVSATSGRTFAKARESREQWGRLVETAVGAHLLANRDPREEILYWRDPGREVDFVVERGPKLTAIEVKSGHRHDALPGMAAFEAAHGPARKLLIGGDGTPLDDFLASGPWVHCSR